MRDRLILVGFSGVMLGLNLVAVVLTIGDLVTGQGEILDEITHLVNHIVLAVFSVAFTCAVLNWPDTSKGGGR